MEVCPEGAHGLVCGERVYHREWCIRCGLCVEECFADALVMAGRSVRVDDVMEEILRDEPYYRHSKGGVTFSGGEPVLQADVLGMLLRQCRECGIHTVIQTAGNCAWAPLEALLPWVDLIMYDLKVLDPELHRRYVGNSGERVRNNLLNLGASYGPIVVRTPVVGGVNDTEEEISNIARFIEGMEGLLYYELLPYHALGNPKRQSLGLPEERSFHTPSKERMRELTDVARAYVKDVRP